MKRRERLIAVSMGIALFCFAAIRAQVGLKRSVAVHSVAGIAKKYPIDTASGRTITPIDNGKFSSVTVWQFKTGIPTHLHREHDEIIYCEQGEGIARLGDEKKVMKPGDFVVIPPNVPHWVVVTSKEPMRGISVFSPPFDGKDRVPITDDGRWTIDGGRHSAAGKSQVSAFRAQVTGSESWAGGITDHRTDDKGPSSTASSSTSTRTSSRTPAGSTLNTQHSTLIPLIHAHAHNDYEHKRPLLDALEHGFCSVEADVWLVDGKLLVAHDRGKVTVDRTLESLYLDPLRQRVRSNKGHVFGSESEFSLLIDVKSDAGLTYAALQAVLKRYADVLTIWSNGKEMHRAITVVISGNRDTDAMRSESVRYAALDGRPPDLDRDNPPGLIRWISASWFSIFKWNGVGEMPLEDRRKLAAIIERAHKKGCRVRFWGTLDLPSLWREQRDAGVDLINADDLSSLRHFLLTEAPATAE